MKIDKPPVCLKLLQNGKKYRLVSEPEADITPEVHILYTNLECNSREGWIFLSYGILNPLK